MKLIGIPEVENLTNGKEYLFKDITQENSCKRKKLTKSLYRKSTVSRKSGARHSNTQLSDLTKLSYHVLRIKYFRHPGTKKPITCK